EFSQLAAEYNVVDLGHGFPDFPPPSFAKDALYNAVSRGTNMHQYTWTSTSKFYGRILGLEIDPMQDVLVTVGAYGALFCTLQALIAEGDEVKPFYNCYKSMTIMAGGKPVYISLKPKRVTGPPLSSGDWVLCPEELCSKFKIHTKVIIINNPNNPLGKIFQREELQMIADLCIKHDVICISDEVNEWLTYDGAQHNKIASFPGMWERTVTIGSAGKSFSATGWKLGWAIGEGHLLKHLQRIHQNSVYHCPTPTQEAMALCFQREYNMFGTKESYFKQFPKQLQVKCKRLANCLSSVGLQPIMSEGGYFIMVDISNLKVDLNDPNTEDELYDRRFVKWLIKVKGLGTIPVSASYSLEQKAHFQKYIRVCFVKDDSTLDAVEDILKQWS
ncbi:kynurenine--oxoglutarate transaminase 1, partial [Silurus asotus]